MWRFLTEESTLADRDFIYHLANIDTIPKKAR